MTSLAPWGRAVPPFTTRDGYRTHRWINSCHSANDRARQPPGPRDQFRCQRVTLSEEGDTLFERATLREALPDVSRVRLEQTLYAEYPTLRQWLERLDREKTEQTPETLADIWDVPEAEALRIATELHEIGFFERRGPKAAPNFWVPFLYRPALHLVQGSADPDLPLLR